MGEQAAATITFEGGLDLINTHATHQALPGTCSELTNFECSVRGGYRRINGCSKFGSAQPTGSADTILGVYPYADGVIAVASDGVYFSTDGATWVQINRDTYVAQTGTVEVVAGYLNEVVGTGTLFTTEYEVGEHIRIDGEIREITAINSNTSLDVGENFSGAKAASTAHYKNGTGTLNGTARTRTNQEVTEFAWLEDDGEYGSIVLTDTSGNNNAARFKITGSGGSRVYFWDDLTKDDFGAPLQPKHCCTLHQRVIFGDLILDTNREYSTVAWSDRYQNLRFDGASAGTIQTEIPVVGLAPFKDRLIIFGRNAVEQVANLNSSSDIAVLPITYSTGCVSAQTIQVRANDIIFLAYDGIRTLSSTEQYGDISLGTISEPIKPLVEDIINSANFLTFSSLLLRNKNQYRLYYSNSSYDNDQQKGLIGTLRPNFKTGQIEWQWSTTQNLIVSSAASVNSPHVSAQVPEERMYHGSYDGYVYEHDTGSDFDGTNIAATCTLNYVDYGDAGRKKTLHYVRLLGNYEGTTDDVRLSIKYDYGHSNVMQPNNVWLFDIDAALSIALYGTAVYGTDTYGGGGQDFFELANVEGSGFTNNFSFFNTGASAPYKLDSMYVDVRLGAKQ